ncbi:MAG: sigma factor, partial [Aquiluna sp.]
MPDSKGNLIFQTGSKGTDELPESQKGNSLSTPDETAGSGAFVTTRWTLVLRAGGEDAEARAALAELCEAYWTPVFHFLRREGRSEEDSRELTQDFFARILSQQGVRKADPGKGRFRSYILGALKHFLADRKRQEGRLKRGGNIQWESIHSRDTDTSPGVELPDPSF